MTLAMGLTFGESSRPSVNGFAPIDIGLYATVGIMTTSVVINDYGCSNI
jgi:hypothetical protein